MLHAGVRTSVFSTMTTNTEGKVRTHVHMHGVNDDVNGDDANSPDNGDHDDDALEPLNAGHETLRDDSVSAEHNDDHARAQQLLQLKPGVAGRQVYSVDLNASDDEEIFGDDETRGKSLD
mmetsp:Transcript_15677/g.23990  ORF Transcript_15677/g.23990 Transcript_15677/m.23990 type:complete len:120 (+) Transcript_15677:2-361(+)